VAIGNWGEERLDLSRGDRSKGLVPRELWYQPTGRGCKRVNVMAQVRRLSL